MAKLMIKVEQQWRTKFDLISDAKQLTKTWLQMTSQITLMKDLIISKKALSVNMLLKPSCHIPFAQWGTFPKSLSWFDQPM